VSPEGGDIEEVEGKLKGRSEGKEKKKRNEQTVQLNHVMSLRLL
jgi:hypothetical protein